MEEIKAIRKPKQKRSKEKKQLIVDTAKKLFCYNGYYNTTTNEIAKEAGVSIGTLYSYFADKEKILLELLEQYNSYFYQVFDFIDTEENEKLFHQNTRGWTRSLIENLIRLHEPQKEFYRELEVLYYSLSDVTKVMDAQNERVRQSVLQLMYSYQDEISCNDIEAASVIMMDFVSALVDRVVFKENIVDKERIISIGVETIYQTFHK